MGQLFIMRNVNGTVLNDYLALKIFLYDLYKCTIRIPWLTLLGKRRISIWLIHVLENTSYLQM
jgi:hypothetical protein